MNSPPGASKVEGTFEFPRLCRYLSERAPQPLLAVEGLTHTIRYLNPAFCKLLGEERSQLIGRPFHEVVPEGEQNGCLPLIDRVFRTGEPELLAEQEHKGAQVRYWSYFCWPVLGEDEQPVGVMIQVTDATEIAVFRQRSVDMNQSLMVTSLRQHELTETAEVHNTELQAATLAKTQFLASMSHEIRTPLNAIMGFSELLSRSDQTDEDRRMYGDRIKQHSHLLLRLIDDILDLSKVEAGRLDIETIEVNLPELFSDVQMVMQHLAVDKGLVFSMVADTPLPATILCDPTRFKQILTNIIGNAIKFTSAGTIDVRMQVEHAAEKLHVIVKDSGEGMTAEQSAKLFQPFTQGDSATTRKFGGTGLGLDLSRRLAKALGGDVVLLRSAAGLGSVFEITIALKGAQYKARSVASLKPKKNGSQIRLDGFSVLLAEDAPDNQLLISKYLTMAGASVDVAEDGEKAVSMTLSGNYDIVLMDIQMPNLDGYKATSRLRGLGRKDRILALTAHAMRSEIEKCRSAGCNGHLAKPFGMHDLVEVVHQMLHEKPGAQGKPRNFTLN